MRAIKTIGMMAALLLTASCSEVELCDLPAVQHHHKAGLRYEFDCSELDANGVAHPENMGVVNYRVVNHWKSLSRVNTETGRGTYMTVVDSTLQQRKSGGERDTFLINPGEYRFMTFAYDSTGVDISDAFRYVNAEPLDMSMGDINIEYKTYAMDDPMLRNALRNWDDYNGYALFMQPDLEGIMVDTTDVMTIGRDEVKTVRFKPQLISQKVDVYFNVTKKQKAGERFVIDSIWAEISGVARRISLSSGKLDISRTGKTMFKMDIYQSSEATGTPSGDSYDFASRLRCHSSFNVSGIVPPSESSKGMGDQATRDYGPGIMQLVIFATSEKKDDQEQPLHKRIQGKVNLYNALRRSPSIVYSEDFSYAMRNGNHCVLDINANITIDGSTIIKHNNNDGGVLKWEEWQGDPDGEGGDTVVEI